MTESAKSLESKLVVLVANSFGGNGSQFWGRFNLQGTVVDTDPVTDGLPGRPSFRFDPGPPADGGVPNYSNLHLTASGRSNTCCIDKVMPRDGGVPLPAIDIDRSPRPKGMAYDVGAHELE